VRWTIYWRDTTIRICSVPQLTHKNLFIKIPSWDKVMGLAEYFAGLFKFGFSKYGHILGKPLCSGPRRRLAGMPIGAQAY
jgi:hypothetical protein